MAGVGAIAHAGWAAHAADGLLLHNHQPRRTSIIAQQHLSSSLRFSWQQRAAASAKQHANGRLASAAVPSQPPGSSAPAGPRQGSLAQADADVDSAAVGDAAPAGLQSMVVTGASSGIGRATAHLLAEQVHMWISSTLLAQNDSAGRKQHIQVVSAASGSISLATAQLLAKQLPAVRNTSIPYGYLRFSQGWTVFAGVRRQEDAEQLVAAHERITPLMLDVTDEASVAAAAEQVGGAVGAEGLTALVNNAGRAITAPVEFLPLQLFRDQLEVNLTGMVAVTQRFLPLLRAGRPGRIVNVGSQSGTVALPMFSPYACSKFGVEALTDCLRLELAPQGVEVCLVSPGAVQTPIWQKSTAAADELLAGAPPEAEALYGRLIRQVQAGAAHAESKGVSAEDVAAVIASTLTAERPHTRQVVGTAAAIQMAVRRIVPDRVWDALLTRSLEKRGRLTEAAPQDPPLA